MANLNKVMLIGRLTRDPEVKTFGSGGKVAKVGFAVNNRKKTQSGQWEDEPVFLDCEAFGKTADLIEQYLHKGDQAFFDGRLKLDQWTDKNGARRSKLCVVIENVQFLGGKSGGGGRRATAAPEPDEGLEPPPAGYAPPTDDANIPF